MAWFTKIPSQPQVKRPQPVAPRPKKGKCKIKFKKKDNSEDIEFSPECTQAQIEMAKQMRAQRNGSEE